MPWRFLDHTADIAVEVTAPTLPGLYAEALGAFTEVLTDLERVEPHVSRRFEVEAAGADLLMVDWLTELAYAFEVEGLLFRRADLEVTAIDAGLRLAGQAWGERRDDARHPIKVLIKAVTYHGLEVAESEAGWRARVVFDI